MKRKYLQMLVKTLPIVFSAFCYAARSGGSETGGCNAKEGNPFKSFWDTYKVDFDGSELFQPLYYSAASPKEMRRWTER